MQLEPVEIGRLAIMQSAPLKYIERRVEEVALVDDFRYLVTTHLQFTVPFHRRAEEQSGATVPRLLIPLGWYAKDRMPDISVQAEDATDLPLLRRRDQGQVVAAIFGIRWRQRFLGPLTTTADSEDAQALWGVIQSCLEQIVTAQRLGAQLVIYRLRHFLWEKSREDASTPGMRCLVLDILTTDEFWRSLKKLGENRLLIARMRGEPGRTYLLSTTNAERFEYGPSLLTLIRNRLGRNRRRSESWRVALSKMLARILAWLGVGRVGIVRDLANLGQAASFWVIFAVPEGVEPLRLFWRARRREVRNEELIAVGSGKVAAGKHHEDGEDVAADKLALDVQIDASPSIATAAALAFLLYLVGLFVYKAMPQLIHEQFIHRRNSDYTTRLLGVGSIIAAAPATIAAALAYRGQGFVRRLSRGPRVALATLAAEGALLAVVASLHGPGELAEDLAFLLSFTGLLAAGLFLSIRCAPRWRKTERSRRGLVTQAASPNRCRQHQVRYAVALLAAWALVVLVAMHTQAAFQRERIFVGDSFPDNVWQSWWHWLGL